MNQGSVKEENWREWARSQKAEVHEITRAYSGSFVKALVDAFMWADRENTKKLLDAFPEYFKQLYQFHLTIEEKRKG